MAEAPPIVVGDLRRAEQEARAVETSVGLQNLESSGPDPGDPEVAFPLEARAAAARADAAHLEQQHQIRQDWLDEHGADLAAARAAGAELARREDEAEVRPFANLSAQELANEIANVLDDLGDVERRIEDRMASIGAWDHQAAAWDHEADAVDWEKLAWTRHTQARQAEAAAAARLTELTEALDRSVLLGGPRGGKRAQLEADAGRIRHANPGLADGTDRTALWNQRGETAWATDKHAAQNLRSQAARLRSQAARGSEDLPRLRETQRDLQSRLERLRSESRIRPGQPAVPAGPSVRQFERTRPNRQLSSTGLPTPGQEATPCFGLEPGPRQPPQR